MPDAVTDQTRTVLLVDDDPTRRRLLTAELDRSGFETLVAAGPDEAGLLVDRLPTLAVVALLAPRAAVDLIRQIALSQPDCLLVFLGASDVGPTEMMEAMEAGVVACLVEPFDPAALPDVLEHVLADEAVLPCEVVHRLVEQLRQRRVRDAIDESGNGALTRREWEVLELMGDGLNTRQIARALFVAPVTIRSHIAAILRKLKLPDRDAAIDLLNSL
ncbi:MAG: response regulator transcription factor [Acidimicrobiia bacterium]